ncbi:MAG: flavin reductase family protein [Burkholderiales bacterium]|nr:flavin reductase family protein [Burkholderiales bacterium]
MTPPRRAQAPQFSREEFRATLGRFATGVTIVTCLDAERGPVGLTANSFNAVSLVPPLVLWSLALTAASREPMARATHFAVNILAADQQALAERFAGRHADRFAGSAWRRGACGAPVLEGSAAVLECFNRNHHIEGDHMILIGEVERCTRADQALPLIFHGGVFVTALADRAHENP